MKGEVLYALEFFVEVADDALCEGYCGLDDTLKSDVAFCVIDLNCGLNAIKQKPTEAPKVRFKGFPEVISRVPRFRVVFRQCNRARAYDYLRRLFAHARAETMEIIMTHNYRLLYDLALIVKD